MSSRGRNFRRRSDDDDGGEEKPSLVAPSKNQKPSRPKSKPSKLLSFADDEEDGDAPAPSRSSRPPPTHSIHKISSSKDRSSSSIPPVPSNYHPQTGEYTKERLLELQKNARPLGRLAVPDSDPPKPPTKPTEPVIVLKGLVKPIRTDANKEQKVKEAVEISDARGDRDTIEESRMFAKLGIDGKKSHEGSEIILNQADINAIKAKRERLRHSRAAALDYIPLDGVGIASTREASVGGSSDDEESDFRGRMSLLASVGGDIDDKKGVFESVEERSVVSRTIVMKDADEEDDVERMWEEEQFRKALGKNASSVLPGVNMAVAIQPVSFPPPAQPSHKDALVVTGGVSRSAEVLSFSQQAEIASRTTREILDKLKETHGRTLSSLVRTGDSLSESLTRITELEKALEDSGKRFVYVQKLRAYVSVLCDFLQDKTPYIEELEEQLQKLREDRASSIKDRRAADMADEMVEIDAPVNAFMSVISRGSGPKYLSAAMVAAQAAIAAARESKNPPVQLDEFGRDLNMQKRMDAVRRADVRKRKKVRSEDKRRKSRGSDNACRYVEGECSTDESDSDVRAYKSSQDEVLQVAGQVLSDAADKYSDISIVKEHLEDWKKQYPLSYRDAYLSLSAPDIFSPFVRLELLRWDPLSKDTDFNSMRWHSLLFEYGLPENRDGFDHDDADANLIPELVEKVALPILHHEIAYCWDIFSRRMTVNAVSAVRLLLNYIPSSSGALRNLLGVVRSRLEEAVTGLVVPRWSTTVLDHILKDVPDAAYVAAYRFGMAVRLLGNICLWKDVLANSVLEEIALVELLNGKILPHLYNVMPHFYDAITRTERVVASLSGVLLGPKGEQNQKLQPLIDYVSDLGRVLEKRHASGFSVDTSDHARSLKKMMVDLNEYDKARAILRTFQIKEAL